MSHPPNRRLAAQLFRLLVPPRWRIHWIAFRNWAGGEPELHLVPELCDPRRTSIDVGACLGIYAYFMRRRSASVIAVEPNPSVAAWLRRALGDGVRVIEAAASSEDGRLQLSIPRDPAVHGMSSVEPTHALTGVPTIGLEVRATRLDSLGLGAVGFIKIDVEGHELAVLYGAAELIERDRPAILVEAEDRHRPNAVESVGQFLARYGYDGWFLSSGHLTPLEEFDPRRDQPPRGVRHGTKVGKCRYINNFVFIHHADNRRVELLARYRGPG